MLLSVVLDRPRGELRLDSHSSRLARLCCMVIMNVMGSNPTGCQANLRLDENLSQDASSVDEDLTQFFFIPLGTEPPSRHCRQLTKLP